MKLGYYDGMDMIPEAPEQIYQVVEVNKQGKNYSVKMSDGFCVYIEGKHGVEPKVGMQIALWGKPFRTIRGIALDHNVLFYRTEAEEEARHKKWCEDEDEKRKRKFAKDKKKLDADYAALPDCFQRRLNKFRTNNPDFRWKYEGYEMFCCNEAMKIIKYFRHPGRDNAKQEFIDGKADNDKVGELAGLAMTEHSGNTYGMSVFLARLYFVDPEKVVQLHGALAPLVGSEEYGCVPRKKGK